MLYSLSKEKPFAATILANVPKKKATSHTKYVIPVAFVQLSFRNRMASQFTSFATSCMPQLHLRGLLKGQRLNAFFPPLFAFSLCCLLIRGNPV